MANSGAKAEILAQRDPLTFRRTQEMAPCWPQVSFKLSTSCSTNCSSFSMKSFSALYWVLMPCCLALLEFWPGSIPPLLLQSSEIIVDPNSAASKPAYARGSLSQFEKLVYGPATEKTQEQDDVDIAHRWHYGG